MLRGLPVTRRGRLRSRRLTLLLAGAAMVLGCGESPQRVATYPVVGSVRFRGQATPGAVVTLHPKSPIAGVPPSRVSVDSQGQLHVTTFLANDGAPAGEYVMTVEWYKPATLRGELAPGPNVVPRKYATPQTSPLSIRVVPGENVLPPISL